MRHTKVNQFWRELEVVRRDFAATAADNYSFHGTGGTALTAFSMGYGGSDSATWNGTLEDAFTNALRELSPFAEARSGPIGRGRGLRRLGDRSTHLIRSGLGSIRPGSIPGL